MPFFVYILFVNNKYWSFLTIKTSNYEQRGTYNRYHSIIGQRDAFWANNLNVCKAITTWCPE